MMLIEKMYELNSNKISIKKMYELNSNKIIIEKMYELNSNKLSSGRKEKPRLSNFPVTLLAILRDMQMIRHS